MPQIKRAKNRYKVLALNCSLQKSSKRSSTHKLLEQVLAQFKKHKVECEHLLMNDFNILPGVESDEGEGDDWPEIRKKILDADILLIGTPIWMGHPTSICQRVMERMDAFLYEKDKFGRMLSLGRVAAVAVVGNEDGAHHVSAEVYQGLNDVGFTIPAAALTYWVGEAMGDTNYIDLRKTPKPVKEATAQLVTNTLHLAKLLKNSPYPGE